MQQSVGVEKGKESGGQNCILGDPQQRGAESEVFPNKGEQNQNWLPHPYLLRGPKEGRSAMSPLRSRGSPTKEDGNKSGPQKGASATSPLCSRGSPNKGTKSKVAHKWAEVLRNPYVLGGPRKGVQKWPAPGSSKNPIVGVLKGGHRQSLRHPLAGHPIAAARQAGSGRAGQGPAVKDL